MAISSEERKILDDFIKENKNLLCSVLNELKDDVDASVLDKVTSTVRDYTTYLFDGKAYTKNRLVLAVVSKYVIDKKPASFIELESAFPPKTQGSYGVVKLENRVNEKDKGNGGVKRYFAEQPIKLSSGEIVLVSTQWGRDNIDRFIDIAKLYGYSIEKT